MSETNAVTTAGAEFPLSLEDATLKKYDRLRITDTTPIPLPRVVIRISNEIISTEENITIISGQSKAGKSALTSVLLAGAIALGEYDGFADISIEPANGKAVVHLDTEQARHRQQSNIKSMLRRTNLEHCPPNLLSYNLRKENLDDFMTITSEIVEAANKKFNGVHMVVADGIADYVRDVNDPVRSNALVKYFEEIAITFSTVIIGILHLNPGNDKERGHLGSQLQRKCESLLTIKAENGVSILDAKLLRMAGASDIPLIQFVYDKGKGYHVYSGHKSREDFEMSQVRKLEVQYELAKLILPPPTSMSYGECIDKIEDKLDCGKNKAKNKFTDMKTHGMIIQGGDRHWRINMEYTPQ